MCSLKHDIKFGSCFADISCPLLESDLVYSDDDAPPVCENGLSQKSFNKAKENFNFLHLNRYVLPYVSFFNANSLKISEIWLMRFKRLTSLLYMCIYVLLVHINCTKGFHCGISIRSYNVL
jgi:hypothetical protein